MVEHRVYKLGFSIIWTVLMALAGWFITYEPEYEKQTLLYKIIFAVIPFFGLVFIWDSLRKLRRFRSVRCETVDNALVYTWVEVDGSRKSSAVDPRIEWDKEDRNFADP